MLISLAPFQYSWELLSLLPMLWHGKHSLQYIWLNLYFKIILSYELPILHTHDQRCEGYGVCSEWIYSTNSNIVVIPLYVKLQLLKYILTSNNEQVNWYIWCTFPGEFTLYKRLCFCVCWTRFSRDSFTEFIAVQHKELINGDLMEFEVQRMDQYRQEERSNWRTEEIHNTGNKKGIFS